MNRREVLAGAAALAACAPRAEPTRNAPFPMRRGVNLGNALEAPAEGEWGYRIEPAHLDAIAAAGFDGVRLPVRWDAHVDGVGRVRAAHMARVAEVLGWALERGLSVQLDAHHYERLLVDPLGERARFLLLWRQIGERFADAPPALMFEPLNEPNGTHWDGAALSDLQALSLEMIRASNPTRLVVFGPGNWQNIDALSRWRPPAGENIAVSVHYYEPHAFTHQGAPWLGEAAPVFDRAWGGDGDRRAVRAHIGAAAAWGRAHGIAMQLGEFGANQAAPLMQRALWTRTVREACEAEGCAWCAWDFAGAFAIWDLAQGAWIEDMRRALLASS